MDSLYLIAATGEPRFQSERDSCEKILVKLDTATLDYLVASVSRDRTPRQRQYTERLFTVIADSGRNPASRRALARALREAPSDTARAQWLYVGSRIGDTAFRAVSLPWLASPSEAVRRMATRALGAAPRSANLPLRWAGLDTLHGLEFHQRLWALEAHSPLRDWKQLAPLLADAHFFNRQKIRDMLLKATDSSWAELRKAMPKQDALSRLPLLRKEWRLLALDAKGGREFLDREEIAMTAEERTYFGMKN